MEQNRISSPGQHGTHEARAARGAGAKSAAGQDGAQDAAAQGAGFALLLAALGEVEGLVAAPAEEDGLAEEVFTALPDPQGEAPDPAGTVEAAETAAWLASQQPGAVLAERLAALAQPANGPVARQGASTPWGEGLQGRWTSLAKPGLDTLVGETAMLDGTLETAGVNGTLPTASTPATGRGSAARIGISSPQEAGRAGLGAVGTLLARAGAATAEMAAPQAAAHAAPASSAIAMPQAMAERRDGAQPLPSAGSMGAEMQAAAAAAAAVAPAGAMAQSGSGQAASQGQGADNLAGLGASDTSAPQPAEADAAFTDAAQTAAEELLADQAAEQVAYWAHQKTQNAELTLDRDGRPVEVKVSLTGDEAHVTFRSDHADARQALDGGAAQLREMLRGEGLHLAGVTVGTAGAGGGQAREGSEREGQRGGRQATVQAAAPAKGARRGATGERSVDIFV